MTKKQIISADFAALSQEHKLELLRRDGVYVGKRKVEGQYIILLQLYSFYVELFYREYRKSLTCIQVSDQVDVLLPYLDQVQVKDLNKTDETQDQ